MSTFAARFRQYNDKHQLFRHSDRLLVAVSGGVDSVVLAHLLHAEEYEFAVAHVNYQLRGDDSAGDARFVEKMARSLDAGFHGIAVDVGANRKSGESTQMVARRIRYNYFDKLLDEYKYDVLITAHHLDDQLETMMINFIRGTGLRGVAGMMPDQHGVCRPLLSHERREIVEYARANSLTWREDSSNASDNYLRNRVRHQLSPLLRELGLTAGALRSTSDHLLTARQLYEDQLSAINRTTVVVNNGGIKIDLTHLLKGNYAETFLYEYLRPRDFTAEQVRQLLAGAEGSSLESANHRARKKGGVITVISVPGNTPVLESLEITRLPFSFQTRQGQFTIQLTERPASLVAENIQYLTSRILPDAAAGATPPSLHLRPRKNGDRLQPLGMGGKSKKVQDLLTDLKIPREDREQLYLLVDEADIVLAIPGVMITELAKVTPDDRTVLKIILTKNGQV
ncbi:tRNA lysidine(34) synthetase TilS [Neolewinella antarctica]|uniref:tRNA(Ile)-lysidine synthase n=1 Tax=Neolewinella antarctica TaxID=442734 RepID=A0ABX0X6H7_9BACT|nr:tRNA lysidine(34) synthetase TilS [Neolewinella antarctica]NJC24742.1 tRNA(Ile)-lysidine synthase [Neolewinella antarctica]